MDTITSTLPAPPGPAPGPGNMAIPVDILPALSGIGGWPAFAGLAIAAAAAAAAAIVWAILRWRSRAALPPGARGRGEPVERWLRRTPRTAAIGVVAVEFPSLPRIAEVFGAEIAGAALRDLTRRLRRHADAGAFIGATGDHLIASFTELDAGAPWPGERLTALTGLLSRPVSVGGCTLHPAFRIGATAGSAATHRAHGLVEEARIALPHAAVPRSPSVFRVEQRCAQDHRRQRLREISAGFEQGEFVPYFQPLVDTLNGHVIGVEALARWRRASGEVETPDRFLDLIAAAGLLPTLGQLIVAQAASAVAGWRDSGLDVPSLSVNFSAEELGDPEMPDRLAFDLDQAGLCPEDLRVEVLETTILGPAEDPVDRSIRRLHALGIQVDLDDFGAGPASISLIGRLDIDRLKIDRGIIASLDQRPRLQALAKAMIEMARALEIEVLAEGVETEAEQAVLSRLGCDALQGYGIAPPMPAEAIRTWLAGQQVAAGPEPRMGLAG